MKCEKWCPGAQSNFSKISFNYRWLEDVENMKVVQKAVLSDRNHKNYAPETKVPITATNTKR